MRLLFLNPNTSVQFTELGVRLARGIVTNETEIVPSTGRFGAAYIASRATAAIAGHAALDAYARDGRDVDVVLIACFGDPGLFALKEMASVPVVGMAEASCQVASTIGRKFSIVTGGLPWKPMLEEFVSAIGLQTSLASVRTIAPSGDQIATDPDAAYSDLIRECGRAVESDGADVIILAGLGLAGIARKIQPMVAVPLLDSVETAVRFAEQCGQMSLSRAGGVIASDSENASTQGLSDALAHRLASRR